MTTTTNSLINQFAGSWKMLRQAINNVSDDNWNEGTSKWVFSDMVLHIISTTDFYCGNSPDEFKGPTSEGKDDPSKEVLLTYLGEMEKKVGSVLQSLKEADLHEKDGFQWFNSIFEKFVYLLRHNSLHLGELSYFLRDKGLKRMEWT